MNDLEAVLLALVRPEIERMVREEVAQQRSTEARPWMTTEETAEYLRLTPDAVRHRAQRGTIPSHKDDAGRWLFHREELDRNLRSSEGSW